MTLLFISHLSTVGINPGAIGGDSSFRGARPPMVDWTVLSTTYWHPVLSICQWYYKTVPTVQDDVLWETTSKQYPPGLDVWSSYRNRGHEISCSQEWWGTWMYVRWWWNDFICFQFSLIMHKKMLPKWTIWTTELREESEDGKSILQPTGRHRDWHRQTRFVRLSV